MHCAKKQYLNYRSAVEQEMTQKNAQKYFHGGEGNEHKQFVPLVLKCSLGAGGNPFALPHSPAECCHDPACETCVSLTQGLNLQCLTRGSHYCCATAANATLWCTPNSTIGLMAIGVCRVVVGSPHIVASADDVRNPEPGTHSVIVSDGDPSNNGTYIFRDDALEMQHIILFC